MLRDVTTLKEYLRLWVAVGICMAIQSCTIPTIEPPVPAMIEGKVLEKGSLAPIARALVKALPFDKSAETDAAGKYSLSIELPDSASKTVTLIISKAGFVNDSIPSLVIQNSRITTVSQVELAKIGSDGPSQTSGEASNIVLVSVETSYIFVAGSGGNETSDITFEVRDSNGTPVDLQHQVTVNFKITGGPGGGEFLSPESAVTGAGGRVSTTVNSGTKAGALQVVATIPEKSIASAPVPVAIHGGLPEINHFSVVPEKLNFAGFNIFGLENKITAFVGDRYSNPVPPGTVVQFQSSGGIIAGSAVTDDLGRATVTLLSASPQPPGIPSLPSPFSEPGFALIRAETVDENQRKITASTIVLFSGRTQLSVTPASFTLAPFKSERFDYTVSDQNNNPLVAGTTISVSTDNGDLAGDKSITLFDTQSRAFTRFSFILTNSKPDSIAAKDATLTIDVKSQNGNATAFVRGQMLPKQ